MSERKIKTQHVYPPIPIRSCDWRADYDDNDGEGPTGWGPTEEAAVADLRSQDDE